MTSASLQKKSITTGALIFFFILAATLAGAQGITWPTNQLLPTFSTPAPVLDCIDVSSATGPENDLFASLEGIVNRTQPQIACVSSGDGEGEFTWLNLHNLPYIVTNGYDCILKYQSYINGLVVTDPNEPDTLNLATTIAGVKNELICDPSLLATLTNAPYNLAIVDDLRGKFTNKYQVYGYLYTNYWPECTHRVMAGLETNLDGNLRDYLVAVKAATVWLDPGTAQDATLLGEFVSQMTPLNGVYIGWWPSEGNGLTWIANYGIPVLASDFFRNGSVFSGVARAITIPPIPPPPPLTNKVYVALILSDGDNAQYMQHVMKMWWEYPERGEVPIGWTADALMADLDPAMLNYYWSTASSNDCLISGPDGPGYAHLELWNSANVAALASASDRYLQRAGLRSITVWDNVTAGIAQAYATNCPTLLGLFDQGGSYHAVNLGLKTIALTPTYASTTNQMISAITSASSGWNGTAPVFVAAQAVTWSLTPADMLNIANSFNTNEYQFVRPDQLLLLYQQTFSPPSAVTLPPAQITANSAQLQGAVTGNATNTIAWMEWGTNSSYGEKTAVISVPKGLKSISVSITPLTAQQVYHYRVAASNFLGMAWGADREFTTGGRLEVWGTANGLTNLPAGLTNVVRIAAGANHALALKNDGTVVAWGSNTYGQTNVPAGLANVVDIAAGIQHSMALMSNGTVVAWGGDTYGQTNVPAGLTNIIAIAAGAYHSVALSANGTVTAWGNNADGQTNVPAGLTNAVGVAAGYEHSMAMLANGSVTAWGWNGFGQTNVPNGLSNVVAIAAGEYDSVALKANAGLWAGPMPASRWLADNLSGGNGSPVSNWVDANGGKSATQTAAGSQPELYTNVLNGHNIVRFASAASQYLTVAAANSVISGAGDFTMVVVFRTSTQGNPSSSFYDNTGLLGADLPGSAADWSFVVNGGELGAGLGAGSGGCNDDFSLYGGNIADGNPHIGAYVRAGNIIRLYVDGAIVAEQNGLCGAARASCPFDIGAMTTAPYYFNGDIAEIQLYTQALNSSEMANLSSTLATTYGITSVSGVPLNRWVADSLSGNNGSAVSNWVDTIGGTAATQFTAGAQPKLYTNVLNGHKTVRFASAASQYLTVPAANSSLSGAGNFSIVVVFRTSTAGHSSPDFYENTGLLGADVPGVVDDWSLVINGSELGAGLGSAANGCSTDFSLYGGTVTDGNPHIGVYVRNADTITLYVDGVIVASQSGLCMDARVDCLFEIGAMTGPQDFFNGDIAEIQLYNYALTSPELNSVDEVLASTYGIGGGAAGTVTVWGSNSSGQTNVPPSLTNVLSVASGSDSLFNLALEANGTVQAWGNNTYGQTNVPVNLTNVTAIAAGSTFGLAIGNEAPLANNVTASGYVNHDLTFALSGSDTDGNPLSFYVTSLPSAGTLYQYANGSPGAAITSPNTLVTDSSGQLIFAPASGGTGTPYATFNFQASDAFYSSGTAGATLNIGLPAVPVFDSTSFSVTNGMFTLNFTGSAGATYSVWSSTNLFNWIKIGTATEGQPGLYQFIDVTASNSPQRFYRISAP